MNGQDRLATSRARITLDRVRCPCADLSSSRKCRFANPLAGMDSTKTTITPTEINHE